MAMGIDILLYGRAGIGKTSLLAGVPNPVILSTEQADNNTLADVEKHIQVYPIESLEDMRKAYSHLTNNPDDYQSVCIDSLSDVCDMIYYESKHAVGSDSPNLFLDLRERATTLLSAFFHLQESGKNLILTTHETTRQLKHEQLTLPSVVGNKLSDDIAHLCDTVCHYTLDADDRRVIYTNASCGAIAKDRSNRLPAEVRVTYDTRHTVLGDMIKILTTSDEDETLTIEDEDDEQT